MKKKQTTFVWLMCSRISLRASIFFVRVYFVRLCQTLLQFHLGGIDNTWNKHKTIGVLISKPCQELIQADLKWNYEGCIDYINNWNGYSEAYMEFKVNQFQIYWKYFQFGIMSCFVCCLLRFLHFISNKYSNLYLKNFMNFEPH